MQRFSFRTGPRLLYQLRHIPWHANHFAKAGVSRSAKTQPKKLGFHTALGACETRQRHALCAVCRWEPKSCAAKGHCHQFSQMGHQKYHGHGDDSQRSCLVQNSMSGKLEETPVRKLTIFIHFGSFQRPKVHMCHGQTQR